MLKNAYSGWDDSVSGWLSSGFDSGTEDSSTCEDGADGADSGGLLLAVDCSGFELTGVLLAGVTELTDSTDDSLTEGVLLTVTDETSACDSVFDEEAAEDTGS